MENAEQTMLLIISKSFIKIGFPREDPKICVALKQVFNKVKGTGLKIQSLFIFSLTDPKISP